MQFSPPPADMYSRKRNDFLAILIVTFTVCWGRALREHDHQSTLDLDRGNWRLLTASLALERSAYSSHSGSSFQGCSLCCWDHLDWTCDCLRFWRAGPEIYCLVATQTSLIDKFPCLLNLPSTNLEWSASSLASSFPLCMGASLRTTAASVHVEVNAPTM